MELYFPSFIFDKIRDTLIVYNSDKTHNYKIKSITDSVVKIDTEQGFLDKFSNSDLLNSFDMSLFTTLNFLNVSPKLSCIRVIPEGTWFVYMVWCVDDTIYIGIIKDIFRRLHEHGTKIGSKYTLYRSPVTLVYQEQYSHRSNASKQEHFLKQLTRKQKLELILEYEQKTKEFYDQYLTPRSRMEYSDI